MEADGAQTVEGGPEVADEGKVETIGGARDAIARTSGIEIGIDVSAEIIGERAMLREYGRRKLGEDRL